MSVHNEVGLGILIVQVIPMQSNKDVEKIILGIILMEFWKNRGCVFDVICNV